MRFREGARTQQLGVSFYILNESKEIINIRDLAEVRTDRIQEEQLQVDVLFNQVLSRFVLTVQDVQVFGAGEIVESILNNIPVNHFFVSLFDSHDRLLHFGLENFVKSRVWTLISSLSHRALLLQTFIHKHFKGGKLQNGSICVLFGEVSVVNRVASQSAGQSCRVSAVLLNGIDQSNEITF